MFMFSHVHVVFLNSSAPQNVNNHTLRALCVIIYEKRPLLVSLPPRIIQNLQTVPFGRLGSLRPDTLTHALLRVKHIRMISGNSLTYHTQTCAHYSTFSTVLSNTKVLLYFELNLSEGSSSNPCPCKLLLLDPRA